MTRALAVIVAGALIAACGGGLAKAKPTITAATATTTPVTATTTSVTATTTPVTATATTVTATTEPRPVTSAVPAVLGAASSVPARRVAPTAGLAVAAPLKVLVVGDSIAQHVGNEGYPNLRTTPGLVVHNLGTISCRLIPEATGMQLPNGPVITLNGPPCQDAWAAEVARFRPDVVVMLRTGPGAAIFEVNGQWTAPCEPLYDNVLGLSLHAQIRMLSSLGARVIVATAAYALLPFLPAAWYLHDDCHNAIFRRVVASEPHAVLADVFSWLCPHLDKPCMRTAGALVVVRPDGLHFLGASARLLAAWTIRQAQRHGVLTNVRVQGPEALELTLPLLP